MKPLPDATRRALLHRRVGNHLMPISQTKKLRLQVTQRVDGRLGLAQVV